VQAEQAYNNALSSLTKTSAPKPISEPRKISILNKVNTAFEEGASYLEKGGKTKLEVKSSIPSNDPKGWFLDPKTKKYYRVMSSTKIGDTFKLMPNTSITNRNEALQFFGANVLPEPEPLNPN
jgi:hypothetical protein